MAEVFYFHVQEDRSIKYKLIEPIMQEDKDVATWRFRIPKVLNQIDMSGWSWWFVYVNAKGQTFSELLTLTDDIDEPSSYSTADYDIDYGISKFPGSFSFALEAISAQQGGEIDGEWHTKTYKHKVDGTLQGNQAEYAETEHDIISALITEYQNLHVGTNQITDGAVTFAKLANDAVTSVKIADGAVTDGKLASNSVSTANVQDGAITEAKVANSAVTMAKLASDSVSSDKVQDGAITLSKLNGSLIDYIDKKCFDVTRYGILPDTGEDLYEPLYTLMHDHLANTGGVVLFPEGEYVISDTIFIPANTVFLGSGKNTRIYFNGEYTYIGAGLTNGGDNVTIANMTVDHLNTPGIKESQRSALGGIGFSTFDFESWNQKHQTTGFTRRETKNLKAINIYSNSTYVLQTEPNSDYAIHNVKYDNIYAPDSLVSIHPHEDGGEIYQVTADNVNCAVFRCGVGYKNAVDITLSNVDCYMMYIPDGATISNCTIDTSNDKGWAWYAYAFFFAGDIIVNDLRMYGGGVLNSACGSYSDSDETVIFNNVIIKDFTRIWTNNEVAKHCYFNNCDFEGKTITIVNGSATNCNAVFDFSSNFLDLTQKKEGSYTVGSNGKWSESLFPCVISKFGNIVTIQGALTLVNKTDLFTVASRYTRKGAFIVVTLMYYNTSTKKVEQTTQCLAICDENGVFKLHALFQDITIYNRVIFNGSYIL